MILTKKVSVAGQFAKLGRDFDEGDEMTILDGGTTITGKFGDRQAFLLKTKNGDRNLSLNQTSINYLIDAYGPDTQQWVGKNVKTWVVDMSVQGEIKAVVILTAPDWKKVRVDGKLKFIPSTKQALEYPENDVSPDDIERAFAENAGPDEE
jgi:hypothetical protein